jgi:lipid-A-disaccharide synthase-like uncharacterized protein
MGLFIALTILLCWTVSVVCGFITMLFMLQSVGAPVWIYVTYGIGVFGLLATLCLGQLAKLFE